MASDPKPPGRKRGRPPNASKPTTSASQDRPDEYEADIEEAARPKQRGRPKKSADAAEQSPPQEEAPKRKRGRPSLDSKDGDATEEAQPKRKRGRPSLEKQQDEEGVTEDAPKPKRGRRPKPTEEQREEQPDENEVVENAEKPKRRRRAKPTEEEQNEEQQKDEEAAEDIGKKKRGKRAKPTEEEQQQDEDEAPQGTKKPKRKARSKATEDEQPEEQEQQPRKRGRKAAQQQEPEPEEADPAPKKRRRREAPTEEEQPEEEQTVRRSPRNSLRDLGPESVHNKGAEGTKSKKKGRASDTREEEAENQQDEAQPKKRGRRKGSRPSTENAEAAKEQEQDSTNKRRRRTSKEAASSSDEELPSPPKPYPHIAPYTRTIKSSTIAAKWTPLTGASLPAASSILTLAHQPILQRTSSTRNRRTHASAALHLVSRRIERKLARGLPFPPASSSGGGARMGRRRGADADGGRALELDFEAVLDGKTALERQLVPAKHAVELLRAEKARMEQELEDDYEKLRKLEADARAQTRERKDLYRKAHVLAPTSQPLPKDPDNTITTDDHDSSSSLKHLIDTPLEPLALQLAGHVESIRGNLQQADGVAPQLARTKAALQDVLHRYLDRGAYEQVLLG
ncbi:hypothetical protein CEP54_013348 [Fusarium duplospermum]|uniref:Cylicin II n=1 Tax=Fusarium duplospermum TaxID=1325734 RepID=A0A428P3F7_9HYPO|nr:hypothetical protein CEP54_013348 [Fusarium duplospermum]